MKTFWFALVLTLAAVLLYAPDLDRVPPYLHHDEVFFANQVHAIATTGRDTEGRFMPASFEVYPGSWFQPVLVYFSTPVLKILPLSEFSIRLPSVVVGALDVLLLFLVARRLFRHTGWAALAATLLMLTPAHFLHARLAMDYIYPLPFVLLWLLCLTMFLEQDRLTMLFLAGASLGVGFFSYVAAWAMMPIYLCTTCAAVLARARRPLVTTGIAVAGFAVPLLLSVPFVMMHPATITAKWRLYGPASASTSLNVVQRLRDLFSYGNLTDRVSLYFEFFNPSYLFMSGGVKIVSSTRTAGVFLLPLAVFIPVGIYQLLQHERRTANVAVLVGFATAPLAAVLVNEHGTVERQLELLPFGVLLATFGIRYLWDAPLAVTLRPAVTRVAIAGALFGMLYGAWTLMRERHLSRSTLPLIAMTALLYAIAAAADRQRRWRPITACLLAAGVLQFALFDLDYFTDYPRRAAGWFEFNRRDAMEAILAREEAGKPRKVFVSSHIQYAESSWRFYCAKHGRDDLQTAMVYFDPTVTPPDDLPANAFVLIPVTDAAGPFPARAALTPVTEAPEPGGAPEFAVFEKRASS